MTGPTPPSSLPRARSLPRLSGWAIFFICASVFLATWVFLKNDNVHPDDYVHNPTTLTENQIDAGLAALIFSKEIHPEVDIPYFLKILDALAYEVRAIVRGSKEPNDQVVAMNKVLFEREGYAYDVEGFKNGDPDRALLSHILETKRGNCFALQILYMTVAQRCGFPIFMVAVPSHAYLRYVGSEEVFNIDATAKGQIYRDDSYMESFSVKKEAIDLGSYCRALNNKEFLGQLLFVTATLIEGGLEEQKKALAFLENAVAVDPLSPGAYMALSQVHSNLSLLTSGDESRNHFREAYENERSAYDLGFVANDETLYAKSMKE